MKTSELVKTAGKMELRKSSSWRGWAAVYGTDYPYRSKFKDQVVAYINNYNRLVDLYAKFLYEIPRTTNEINP